MRDEHAIKRINSSLALLSGGADLDSALQAAAGSSYVLIGEASHGTHEFYDTRAEIMKRLIQERGFLAVAVEADWPDAHRVDRYVRDRGGDNSPRQALSDFKRFPRCVWRNRDVERFVGWLRGYNDSRPKNAPQVGFYGLDLYSMNTSREEVIRYLDVVDPEAARRARARYACFDHFGEDEQAYGMGAGFGVSESCEKEVVQQLSELRRRSYEYMSRDGQFVEDDFFAAEQNARLVRNAEEYYRSIFRGRISSWNLRDRHMAGTLDALADWLTRRFGCSKVVVWEHNSHLGDARATEMGRRGEYNVGQLVRERYPNQVFNIGFTTNTGTVMAASDWGGEAETKRVRPALQDSWEELFHRTLPQAFWLNFRDDPALTAELAGERLERAIGVIYRPETERTSHYFYARMPEQFDAVIHIETTRAVEPLDASPEALGEEDMIPETFPSGV